MYGQGRDGSQRWQLKIYVYVLRDAYISSQRCIRQISMRVLIKPALRYEHITSYRKIITTTPDEYIREQSGKWQTKMAFRSYTYPLTEALRLHEQFFEQFFRWVSAPIHHNNTPGWHVTFLADRRTPFSCDATINLPGSWSQHDTPQYPHTHPGPCPAPVRPDRRP